MTDNSCVNNHPTLHNKKSLIFILAVPLLLLIGIWIVSRPYLFALYHQRQGGILLDRVMRVGLNGQDLFFACELDATISSDNQEQLRTAVAHLEAAVHYKPELAQAYLLLGRAYCLLDEPNKALDAFQKYIQLHPDSPLGYLESGFAKLKLCLLDKGYQEDISESLVLNSDIGFCQNPDLIHEIHSEWKYYNVNTNLFINRARSAFNKKLYSDAYIWFRRTLIFQQISEDKLTTSDQYKWAISSIIIQKTFPKYLREIIPIISLDNPRTITSDQLRIFVDASNQNINYGDPITSRKIDQSSVAIMYFRGPFGILINSPQSEAYTITVKAQNTPPAPVILSLEHNNNNIGNIELNREDQSWQTFQFKVNIEKGIHLLTLNFINDAKINGIDRNAVIEWIKIEPAK